MVKLCNAGDDLQALVKRCRFGYWKDGQHYCRCTKSCKNCSVGGVTTNAKGETIRKVEIFMHPELREAKDHDREVAAQYVNI
jgi:hypothetical protein